MQDPTDRLSPLARRLLKLDCGGYDRLVATGPGNTTARDLLDGVRSSELLASPVVRQDDADALLAGLWLYFDCLGESHRLSQRIETASGSFWHAIMHRREGDFSNSKYWYARCAGHPALGPLAGQSASLINAMPADKSLLRLIGTGWNPNAFVDLVEAVHEQPDDPRFALSVSLQRLEWQVLFDHCTRTASSA